MSETPRIRERARRAIQVTEQEATVTVHRTAYGAEQPPGGVRETIKVPVFHTDPAYIRVSGGHTMNLGDFNSLRVDVSVTLPCLPEMSEMDRAYAIASEWVEARLIKEVAGADARDQSMRPE
jgi:hypothetical protein